MKIADRRGFASERGSALVLVLLVALLILLLGGILAQTTRVETAISRNDHLGQRALAVAEAGLNHARVAIAADVADGLDDEIDGSGTGGIASIGTAQALDGVAYVRRTFDDGFYYVRAIDNFDETATANVPADDVDNSIRVQSIGIVGNARRQVEGNVFLDQGPDCAITTQDDMAVSGNMGVAGVKGCVHTNGDMTSISGNPNLSEGATASGSMAISGNPTMKGELIDNNPSSTEKADYAAANSSQDLKPIPRICPLAFGNAASPINLAEETRIAGGYLLAQDCKVYQGGSSWGCVANSGCTPVGATTVDPSGTWHGWVCAGGAGLPAAKWNFGGNTIFDQGVAFFIAGWFDFNGNPGEGAAEDWRTTIIALNTIKLGGNPGLEPAYPSKTNPTHPLRNLLLVSGNDLQISGSAGSPNVPGALLAHEQVKFNGNPAINGFVMSEDGNPDCMPDSAPHPTSPENVIDFNDFGGNAQITYNGLDTSFFGTNLRMLRGTWNEVRSN